VSARNPHYLLKVLGLSAVPRLVTFGLTLLSLPLMVRALGAESYGVMVYLQSAATILEIVAGAGVASAAGREVAAFRSAAPQGVADEVFRWARLQGSMMAFSILPVLGAGALLVAGQSSAEMTPAVLAIVALTLYAAVIATFTRQVLQSMLAFKWLAALDTTESVVRSSGWLAVAALFPTTLGLALAGLVTSTIAAAVGVTLTLKVLRRHQAEVEAGSGSEAVPTRSAMSRLRASLSFMGLVISTRAFHSVPAILIGRLAGFEYAGILGAFQRVVEIFALPFTVIGNALMVRAHEVKARGPGAAASYWDMLTRFAIVALAGVLTIGFVVDDIRHLLLPENPDATHLFAVLMPLLLFRASSDLFAPASDYVGGLRARVVFLGFCALVQAAAMWWASQVFGPVVCLAVIVVLQAIMLAGYVLIAKRVFFGGLRYRPPRDFPIALAVLVLAWTLAVLIHPTGIVSLSVFVGLVAAGFLGVRSLREQYASGRFLRFEVV
jgi:O-antigen/teichoic acid export membrane protein